MGFYLFHALVLKEEKYLHFRWGSLKARLQHAGRIQPWAERADLAPSCGFRHLGGLLGESFLRRSTRKAKPMHVTLYFCIFTWFLAHFSSSGFLFALRIKF